MHIGIDLDDTLVDLRSAIHAQYNAERPDKAKVPIEMFHDWTAGRNLNMSSTEFFGLLRRAWSNWFSLMNLQETDAAQTIAGLQRDGHIIHIISNRERANHKDVTDFLHHEDIPYDIITLIDQAKVEKLDFPIDILIDDHPDLVNRVVAHSDKMVLLYTQPWNKDILDPSEDPFQPIPFNIERVNDLHEAAEFIYRVSR